MSETRGRHPVGAALRVVFALAVTVGALVYLIEPDDWTRYLEALSRVAPVWLAASVAALWAGNLFRAARLKVLVGGGDWGGLTKVVATSTVLAAVLPFRIGEIGLPVLLARRYTLPASRAVGVFLVARLLDLLVLIALSGVVAFIAWPAEWSFAFDRALFLAAGIGALVVALGLPWAVVGLKGLLVAHVLRSERWTARVEELAGAAAGLRSWGARLAALGATVGVWGAVLVFYALIAASLDVAGPLQAAFAGLAATFAAIQPVNGVAGLGVIEFAWAEALRASGADWALAVSSAFLMHLTLILASLAFLLIAAPLPERRDG